ncbi:MAG TPA: TlpA disulfide reductase family protein [Xanthobacteraceae bacterium]|nr:TlpA disulfide reductase family protein [Xanthobacteraceae bacterium]
MKAPSGNEKPAGPNRRRAVLVASAVAAAILLGFAGIYGIAGLLRNRAGDPECKAAVDIARRLAPLVRGEVAAVTMASEPLRLPDLTFQDANGRQHSLQEWRARTVLLNLWATWCVPCGQEMPALDALKAKLGGPDFDVVAVNIDTRDPDKPKAWFKDRAIRHLTYYADPEAKVFQDLRAIGRAVGMPTTVLLDPKGCEIGTIAGPAEWASDDGVNLIRAALQK